MSGVSPTSRQRWEVGCKCSTIVTFWVFPRRAQTSDPPLALRGRCGKEVLRDDQRERPREFEPRGAKASAVFVVITGRSSIRCCGWCIFAPNLPARGQGHLVLPFCNTGTMSPHLAVLMHDNGLSNRVFGSYDKIADIAQTPGPSSSDKLGVPSRPISANGSRVPSTGS